MLDLQWRSYPDVTLRRDWSHGAGGLHHILLAREHGPERELLGLSETFVKKFDSFAIFLQGCHSVGQFRLKVVNNGDLAFNFTFCVPQQLIGFVPLTFIGLFLAL